MLLADLKKSDCYNERLKKMSINMAVIIPDANNSMLRGRPG